MSADYKVLLANSSDLSVIADLSKEATGKSLTLAANQAGNFSFGLNTGCKWSNYLIPLKYCIIVRRNDKIEWSGPIWTVNETFESQSIEIGCVGWLEILFHRYNTGPRQDYNNVNAGTIAFNLLNLANADYATWIIQGSNTNTQARTFTIEQWENIGDHLRRLTEVENGIDLLIDPATRQLKIFASTDFDVSDAHFGFNTGTNNLKTFSRTADASDMANQYYARGKIAIAEAHDNASMSQFGNKLQQVVSVTDITDVSLLGAIANAELAVNAYPRVLYTFTPIVAVEETRARMFDDYNVRDQVFVSAKQDNAIEILDQPTRVFGVNIEIDDNGNEIVNSIQVTYQSA